MKILNTLSSLALLFSFSFLLCIAYFLFWPAEVIKFKNPLPVQNKQVAAGAKVNYSLKYEKLKDAPATIIKNLHCPDILEELPVVEEVRQDNIGHGYLKLSDTIPLHVSSAKNCHIIISLEYRLNFFRVIEYTMYTESFEVINTKL